MTLLITIFAAVFCTALWYKNALESDMKLGMLCWMFWGASIMWFCDAVAGYLEEGEEFFNINPVELLNDFYLGLAVVALALVVWIAYLLYTDPKGVIKSMLVKKQGVRN
ncbi:MULTISPECIES: hypothetical protein [unclassified Campylobacter]|uniref:hypothetical protein n=1 Tax=unclassified Campylobacter TaxID=2593542 RepID=UPI001237AAA6|nr:MULTISPECIES: hypothetical protein [unclassified Campylobacter]KAA6225185.1 hypothetical protein FMM55_07870 [Campylobacter sp. LR196d]KAA6226197.1 hypothetical protein FMM54_05245 [Campylobacter sp. LR185c]KAA6229003.1 hypothetical protein FMM57_02000 [Campylobacter sp. LR286c]KAA8604694.1 hypothetical protein CGP82_01880 [Campylobacter sp. LR185c]